jgi:3-dehydroquinate synthetase
MAAAAHLGTAAGITPREVGERQNRLLERAGLPIRVRALPGARIMGNLRYDKKIRNEKLRFILTPEVGSASVREQLWNEHLRHAIDSITMS